MPGVSSGIGLISGINIEDVINQYMAIEARPRNQLAARIKGFTEQRTAMMKIQALVMSVQIASNNFNKESVFQNMAVTSSNEDLISATASRFAAEGTYRFVAKRLASNHHFVSRGYTSMDSGIGSGTLSFEIGQGQVAKPTDLNSINGGRGFQRGKIKITDRAGNTDQIDLTIALTMQDVIDEINKNSTVNVTASVSGNHLIITDNNTGATGNLIVADIGSGTTAMDLGIRGNVTQDKIIGNDILYVTADTLLSDLNDGNGVRGLTSSLSNDLLFKLGSGREINVDLKTTLSEIVGAPDQSNTLRSLNRGAGVRMGAFRITDQNGRSIEIDLAALGENATLGQLKEAIESTATANNMNISVGFGALDHLKITDNSDPLFQGDDDSTTERRSHFIIEDIDGGFAAGDLGIVADVSSKTITGDQVWHMESLGDVINAVNNHWENTGELVLSFDSGGNGIRVTDNSGLGNLAIEIPDNGSMAAEDLGLLTPEGLTGTEYVGRQLIAGLNTVMLRSLNGGSGSDPDAGNPSRITSGGTISLTDRDGHNAQIDLSGAFTVQDIIDAINDSDNNINISASLNAVGNGIVLTDSSSGSGNMIVADVTGELAQKLGIAVNDTVSSIDSGNLQLQYVSEATQLDDLRQGEGVYRGKFKITDGLGRSATIDLGQVGVNTIDDVISKFENSATGIRARVNNNGDGLLLYDTSEGDNLSAFFVVEENGSTAHDLGILGTAKEGEDGSYYLDGSYEFKLEVGGGDGIEDIVNRINDADMGLKASIINDGVNYRINFNSQIGGRSGMVYLDAGTTDLTTDTLSEGRDAIVLLGDGSDEHPLLITSSTNTINNAIKGVTLDLNAAGSEAVTITVEQDIEAIVAQISSFVDAYNSLMEEISKVTMFDPESYEHGVLFADHTVNYIQSSLQTMVQRNVPGVDSKFSRLSQIGVSFAPFGSEIVTDKNGEKSYAVVSIPKLAFNEQEFRDAFAENPEKIAELFTKEGTGVGDYIADHLEDLAGSNNSTISNNLDAMQSNQGLFEKRIEYLDELLVAKEERYYREFYAMEQALASMQAQMNALTTLSNMATMYKRQ